MSRARGGRFLVYAGLFAVIALTGCAPRVAFGPKAERGVVFYCPGAGNYDCGDVRLREGLVAAGYDGEVQPFYWTIAPLGPLGVPIDQIIKLHPRLRSARLADEIERYVDRYPGRPVNVVGLSAGTGVALWAVQHLRPGYQVDNVVLLSSSVSSAFDVTTVLPKVRGCIYNYHSAHDAILALPMRLTGTIDGDFGHDAAGLVGLVGAPPDRVVNIAWRRDFRKLGYFGGHVDSTSAPFVRAEIAPRLLGGSFARGLKDAGTEADQVHEMVIHASSD
jgi:pimeloyl-ACP methyl ester carboxylesterase